MRCPRSGPPAGTCTWRATPRGERRAPDRAAGTGGVHVGIDEPGEKIGAAGQTDESPGFRSAPPFRFVARFLREKRFDRAVYPDSDERIGEHVDGSPVRHVKAVHKDRLAPQMFRQIHEYHSLLAATDVMSPLLPPRDGRPHGVPPLTRIIFGSTDRDFSIATGHRVWNLHPGGGFEAEGRLPERISLLLCLFGWSRGTEESRARE